MRVQKGSWQYYADELGVSIRRTRDWGKEECEKRIQIQVKNVEVVESSDSEVSQFNSFSDIQNLIVALEDPISNFRNNDTAFLESITAINKKTLADSVLYCHLFASGQLKNCDINSMRANFCYKIVKGFSPRIGKKSVKKASITNKTSTSQTLIQTQTTESQEEKSLDLDNEG